MYLGCMLPMLPPVLGTAADMPRLGCPAQAAVALALKITLPVGHVARCPIAGDNAAVHISLCCLLLLLIEPAAAQL